MSFWRINISFLSLASRKHYLKMLMLSIYDCLIILFVREQTSRIAVFVTPLSLLLLVLTKQLDQILDQMTQAIAVSFAS